MLESETGDATLLEGVKPPERSIHQNSEQLLMEAARRSDETTRTRRLSPPVAHPVSSSALTLQAPKLIQFDALGEAITHVLKPTKTSVGRAPHNDLCLPVDAVSSIHCDFEVRGQRLVVTDQHSLNGTFVNGQRVINPVELNEGDTIHIGGVALRFFWHSSPQIPGG
ncbi:MAG: FHA domain-containing protein [Blastochloris sp.]|nr:FHA domain-containing protein [Blastochloris sp.]